MVIDCIKCMFQIERTTLIRTFNSNIIMIYKFKHMATNCNITHELYEYIRQSKLDIKIIEV